MSAHTFELLAARREGPLAAGDEERVRAHLAQCAACRAYDHELARNDALLRSGANRRVRVPPFDALARAPQRGSASPLLVGAAMFLLVIAAAALLPAITGERAPRAVAPVPASAIRALALPAGTVLPAPAGELIAVRSADRLALYDSDAREVARHDGQVAGVRWLADGSAVAVAIPSGGGTELAILERAGLRRTGLTLPADPYFAGSLDGRSLAAQTSSSQIAVVQGTQVLSRVDVPEGATLLGWDAEGAVLVISGATLRAHEPAGPLRWSAALPPALGRNVRYGASPDRSAVVIAGSGGAWVLRDRSLVGLPPVDWIGGHEVLVRRPEGGLAALDVTTGAERTLPARLGELAEVRGSTDGHLVVSPGTGDLLLVAIETGQTRTLPGLRRTDAFERVAGGRLLIPGTPPRVLDASAAFR